MEQSEIDRRIRFSAERIRRFIKDNGYLWTKELSSAKSGEDTLITSDKRFLSRNTLYSYVGAGGILGTVSINDGYYISALEGWEEKVVEDHVIPPQLLGEYFLDKLNGFYTEKDISVLEDLEMWIRCCFKTCSVTAAINHFLSYHSCYHKNALGNPRDFIPLVISKKYQYLNENSCGVKNSDELMGKLTIMKNGVNATNEEIAMLFETPEGFDEWQTEKYAAVGFDVEYSKTMVNLLSRPTGLEQFMGV